MSYVTINNVVKRYNIKPAVDNISLEIREGEIFGLLGPNGAGKTTTIKMLTGLLNSENGEIKINGKRVTINSLEVKREIGFVPQDIAIYNEISAFENVEFFGMLYGIKGKELRASVDSALEFVGLSSHRKELPKTFSGGMKRRLNIACALVHNPKLIVMDEPTVGIDPQSRNHILESVRALNKMGATIIYTSHYMEEVEVLCHRVAIMDHGKLIALGAIQELKTLLPDNQELNIEVATINSETISEIRRHPLTKSIEVESENNLFIKGAKGEHLLQDILFILGKNEIKTRSIKIIEPNLEGVFLHLTGRTLRD
jgi:ABC-2 type transport system ATP-binding protein